MTKNLIGATERGIPMFDITLTDDQMNAIKSIEVDLRYDAMDKVAEILGVKVGYKTRWGRAHREIRIDEKTNCEITFRKGKVTELMFFDDKHDVFYNTINIKKWKIK